MAGLYFFETVMKTDTCIMTHNPIFYETAKKSEPDQGEFQSFGAHIIICDVP